MRVLLARLECIALAQVLVQARRALLVPSALAGGVRQINALWARCALHRVCRQVVRALLVCSALRRVKDLAQISRKSAL